MQILQSIASIMPTDRDVSLLSRTCKEMHSRLMATESSIWRTRFKERYDMPPDRKSEELKPEYQTRAIVLPIRLDFRNPENDQQRIWLEVIQTMVKESTTLPIEIETSKTYQRVREVMSQAEFLSKPKRIKPSDIFCALQLVCHPQVRIEEEPTDHPVESVPNTHVSRSDRDPSLWSIRLRYRHSVLFSRGHRWPIHQAYDTRPRQTAAYSQFLAEPSAELT
jgi:hypothetical protein